MDLLYVSPERLFSADVLERLGAERAQLACRQALDLQSMRGEAVSLPVLLVETCGVGLIERQQLRRETGLPVPEGEGMVLLFSRPRLQFQLMQLQR
ncbi:MAG: hypothetical protein EBU42_09860 [Synechococcus sp.]|nr:hypothetical protein [Synechococcus sp.]